MGSWWCWSWRCSPLRIRHPEPNGSRWATPPSLIQQRPGQSPQSSRCFLDGPLLNRNGCQTGMERQAPARPSMGEKLREEGKFLRPATSGRPGSARWRTHGCRSTTSIGRRPSWWRNRPAGTARLCRGGLTDGRILPLPVDTAATQGKLTLYDVVLTRVTDGSSKTAARADLRDRRPDWGHVFACLLWIVVIHLLWAWGCLLSRLRACRKGNYRELMKRGSRACSSSSKPRSWDRR